MPKPTRATVVIESNSWNHLAAVILDDGRYSITTEWCNYASHQVQARHGQDDAEIDLFLQWLSPVSYTHLRAHETVLDLVCRLLLEKKKQIRHL